MGATARAAPRFHASVHASAVKFPARNQQSKSMSGFAACGIASQSLFTDALQDA
jgi:hypothetical protein